MLAACRLAGLSALILDYGGSGARTQFPNADRPARSVRSAAAVGGLASAVSASPARPAGWRLRPAPHATETVAGGRSALSRPNMTAPDAKAAQRCL